MPRSIKAQRTVDLAAASIREAILGGEYPPGSWLPPERSLAGTLGINRLTLRAALARLQAEGLVRPEQGNGVLVLDYRGTAGLELLPYLATAGGGGELIRSFLELRRVVAAEAVALACERATAEQLAFLGELAEQQQQEEDAAAFAERDLRFARALVRSAGNLAMELLLNSVERIYLSLPEVVTAMHADRPAVRASYSQVVGLVQARQATLARVAVRMVLEKQDARTLEMLSNRADAGERPC